MAGGVIIDPDGTVLLMDGAAIDRLLRSQVGPVGRDLERRGTNVQALARVFVRKRTGRLARSIVKRWAIGPGGMMMHVGSDLPYAAFEHEGTRAHVIVGAPLLVFYWPKAGRVVAFPQVNHPGTTGSQFLRRALSAAVR